jgi:hypothetical protein
MVARGRQARKYKKRPKALSNNGNTDFFRSVTGLDKIATMIVCRSFSRVGFGSTIRTYEDARMIARDELDPLAPQREAAMFYGLFLRGHSADALRRDIDVPRPMLDKWLQPKRYEDGFRDSLRQMYSYRKKVLAIFDELVTKERVRVRVH